MRLAMNVMGCLLGGRGMGGNFSGSVGIAGWPVELLVKFALGWACMAVKGAWLSLGRLLGPHERWSKALLMPAIQ